MNNFSPTHFSIPTNIVIVDDDEEFLEALLSALPDNRNHYTVFSDPLKAIDYLINNKEISLLDIKGYLNKYNDEKAVYLDQEEVFERLSNPDRFSNISMLVIDYQMKTLNGLELLKKIKNKNLKKVLLTGVADEVIANKAFNEGLIDNYIKKQDTDGLKKLIQLIDQYNSSYYNLELPGQDETPLAEIFYNSCYKKLADEILNKEQIVEYYLIDNKGSLLLFDAKGNGSALLITNESEIKHDIKFMEEEEYPENIVNELKLYRKMLFCYDFLEYDRKELTKNLYPIYCFDEENKYYYAFINNIKRIDLQNHTFFESYRNKKLCNN
ncbi:MAG: response regulator [Sphingobacteriia bacterium]|nr:response regulator [Sphingobacteriia bacterium]